MSNHEIPMSIRRLVRTVAGVWSNCPVEIVPGSVEPTLRGQGWHYRTRGGSLIHHPSAYRRFGWSNAVYHSSSYRVEVGSDWINSLT